MTTGLRVFLVCLLTACTFFAHIGTARAEGRCPAGMYPIDSPGVSACVPIPQQQQVVRPSAGPRYKSQWGAIAKSIDPASGQMGSSAEKSSKAAAEKAAIKDCEASGDRCKIWVHYSDQCVAVVTTSVDGKPAAGSIAVAFGATIGESVEKAILSCQTSPLEQCMPFYSACSLPKINRGLLGNWLP